MAAKKKTPKEQSPEKSDKLTPVEQFDSFLQSHDTHFNFAEEIDYNISSGSLKLDIEIGGGLHPGVTRFCGTTESGKTSSALSFVKNFLDTVDNSFAFYIKAEGGARTADILSRSGLGDEKYKDNFRIYKNNIYEEVINLIEGQIKNNPLKTRYMFVIDSMDSLNLRADLKKDITGEESPKVAGSAGLSSLFLKRMTLMLCELGHLCIMLSQKRANMSVQKGKAPARDERFISSSGGFALLHYSDWIFEFKERSKKHTIFLNEKADFNDKFKSENVIGHNCVIEFSKSPNEKKFVNVNYPIKHGRTGGRSIWREIEVSEFLLAWKYAGMKGSWISFSEETMEQAKKDGYTLLPKMQGKSKFVNYLEENQDVCDYFYKVFLEALKRDV
jgi:RecA/RadA recombinase